jgi:hypothetical protein
MGSQFIKTDELNPKGYYEDIEFVNLNKYLLKLAGGDWYNIPPEWKILELAKNERPMQLIKELVDRRTKKYDRWGFKDPRTCLTIRLYLPYLPEHYLYASFRSPRDIAASLKRCHGKPLGGSLRLAKEYNKRLLKLLTEMNQSWR